MAKKPKINAATTSVRIVSSAKEGFRRGGIAHDRDTTWPAGSFTDEQLRQIEDEPLLTVIEVPEAAKKAGA